MVLSGKLFARIVADSLAETLQLGVRRQNLQLVHSLCLEKVVFRDISQAGKDGIVSSKYII